MKKKYVLSFIGLIILIYLIINIGFNNILNSLLKIKIIYLPLIILFLLLNILSVSYKLQIILKRQRIKIKLFPLAKIILTSFFYAIITPGKIGYFSRIFYLKRKTKNSISEILPSIIIDRFLDAISLLMLAILGSLLIIDYYSNLYIILTFIFILSIFLFWFFKNKERSRLILRMVYKLLVPEKYQLYFKETFNVFYDNLPQIRNLIIPLILTFIAWILYYSVIYLIALSLEIKINYLSFILIYPLVIIISLIPVTIAGLGVREAGAIVIFGLFGIEASKLIVLSLLGFLFTDVMLALLGFYFSLKEEKYESINNNSM